jgi:hypothetical protein
MPDLGNPRDRLLPFIMFLVAAGFGAYFFFGLVTAAASPWVAGALSMFAFLAGAMFMMFTDRRGPR